MQKSHNHNSTYIIVGTVLCTVFLGFVGMMTMVSMNWHRPSGISVLLLPAWCFGLVFRILRPTGLKLLFLVAADLFITALTYDELILRHDLSIHPQLFSKPFFWVVIAGTVLIILDWAMRIRWRVRREFLNSDIA